jgi:hypothetical protein
LDIENLVVTNFILPFELVLILLHLDIANILEKHPLLDRIHFGHRRRILNRGKCRRHLIAAMASLSRYLALLRMLPASYCPVTVDVYLVGLVA